MHPAFLRRGPVLAAILALLSACATGEAERQAQAEAARQAAEAAALAARTPPPVALNASVAEAASIYVAFTRDMAALEGGFQSPEAVQAALRRGASYDPNQVARGLVAYAAILALQSPEFVEGVRRYAVDRQVREQLAANLKADPRWVLNLPGADAGAAMIMGTLREEFNTLGDAADSVENDAYNIQQSWDPRRSWAVAHVRDRQARLDEAKARSRQRMPNSAADAARLAAAATGGRSLNTNSGARLRPPYPPAVERALALAALAALGEAGENARAATDAMSENPEGEACLSLSKLMLFQCLAASRPSYEDMFCLGRHVIRDLETCSRGSALPAALVSVSDVATTDRDQPRTPAIAPAPLEQERPPAPPRPTIVPTPLQGRPAPTPVPTPVQPAPTPRPSQTPTERLNTQPGG